jgi:16S rRNA (adenine1518-N6/adenine1519-N6)-dimethyltransferase
VSNRSKRFGQHFLNSRKLAERIVRHARVDNELVIEIGPGKGILTKQLAKRAGKVIAVELDRHLADYLAALNIPGVDVMNLDFLSLKLSDFENPIIVGNIPYGITTAIIEKLAAGKNNLKKALLTIQKEYGARMVAAAGASDYGFLSIYANYHFHIKREFVIPARYFSPRPKVSSVVVTIMPKKSLLDEDYERKLFGFVSGVFRYRRKSLKNAILNHLEYIPDGLDPMVLSKRPQHLHFDDFHRIYSKISRLDE